MPVLDRIDPYARLEPVESVTVPFRYFVANHCLDASIEPVLLDWLEADAPWTLVETDFYEQFEFDLRDADLPPALSVVNDPINLMLAPASPASAEHDNAAMAAHKRMNRMSFSPCPAGQADGERARMQP